MRSLLLILLIAAGAAAQTFTGNLQGIAVDPQGAVVAGVQITVSSKDRNISRRTTSGGDGSFRIEGLEPGSYSLSASAPNLQSAGAELQIQVGETTRVRVPLGIPSAQSRIEVNEVASTPTLSNPISRKEIEDTPLAQRSFANISFIAPMTAPVEPSDPTKARITAVSFAGSSGLNVDLSVDGGDNNDDWIGGFLQNYSPETLQEFNVRTAQFEADTSRTNGGSVVISTRSGTNDWHGSATGYFRADALNARNVLDNPEPDPKQPYSRQDFVGTLGGPLKKDKLWLFASYEYIHENGSVAYNTFSQSQFTALGQLAAAGQIPGVSSIAVPKSADVPFGDNNFSARLDWAQSERSRWFGRFSLDRNHTDNDLVQQGALPETGFTTDSNYYTFLLSNQFEFSPHWSGSAVIEASYFDHEKTRNSNLGFALAFPFSTTVLTTSGFETFGDNQFVTAITAFPIYREQQKYQFRYDVSHSGGKHNEKFGINFIHEPVLRGRFSDSAERLIQFDNDPDFYVTNGVSIAPFFTCDPTLPPDGPPPSCPSGPTIADSPAGNGNFAQSVRRLGLFAQDDWHVSHSLTFDYGLRYDTTFGLFQAEGKDQSQNPTLQALNAAGVHMGVPHDYRGAVSPRIGVTFAPASGNTVWRAGFGLYYNDLAQNGWAEAFQAVNGDPNAPPSVIDPNYHTPYAIQASTAIEHEFGGGWNAAVQFEHQGGVHQYRRYEYVSGISLPAAAPSASIFKSDNRSRYDGVSFIARHRGGHYDLTAHYTFSKATTWGATVGELFDYVNGVSDALNPFGPGDHGPSGEDIRHRFVLQGVFDLPWQLQVSTLAQFESARPFTMFTPVDINGDGNVNDRAVVNGVQTSLDEFRGKAFQQVDLRISRQFAIGEHARVRPFAEFFNLFNRQNPGNNYLPDISALPVNDITNATAICLNAACTQQQPIKSLKQISQPAGALGDFFGPGTTVGIPFAAQLGVRVSF